VSAESGFVERRSTYQSGLWQVRSPCLHTLDVELTERCNNACRHCYINLPMTDAQARDRELSTAEWHEIFRQAAELGALGLRITGGEPLLREDFKELYLFARRLGLKVTLYTNARRITLELAELFARVPPLEKIEISVYGLCPESYDAAACSPGAFVEFREGLELLLQRKVPFLVKSAFLPSNRTELDEFDTWAQSLPGMDSPPGLAVFYDLRARRDSMARNHEITRLRVSPEEGLRLQLRIGEERFRRQKEHFCRHHLGPTGARLFDCGAGLGGCVDAYGRYQPCMLLRDPRTSYDMRKDGATLEDALGHFFPEVRKLESTNPTYLERCGHCFLHGLCEQCPAKSWMEHGTLDTPTEYQCRIAHAQAIWLGLLAEGERAWEIQDWRERLKQMGSQNKMEE
jgi:radical SAM protein with 4Fe4S-binding SPASM domain